ncbi:MAG TPA: MaoC family dehydratase [Anaerolineales bacterium]
MTGKYYDELQVGDILRHGRARTITEAEHLLFSGMTQNTQPLHLDEEFARQAGFEGRIVNGILTLGLVIGITVPDLTEGTIVANIGYQNIQHPTPVYHGDTISVESEVLEKRASESKSDRGIVRLRHLGRNQKGEVVIEVERTVMFLTRPEGRK